ncbi:MAG TPA: cytochrome c [Candidatus Dormibacteraeota bacterium]|nr:cytochrome c [Candidatus Dormibacteraeota bacterium]
MAEEEQVDISRPNVQNGEVTISQFRGNIVKRDPIHSVDSGSTHNISVKRFGKTTQIAVMEVAEEGRKPVPQGLKPIGSQAVKVGAKAPTPERRTFSAACIAAAAVAVAALAIAGAVFAQDAPAKKTPPAAGAKASAGSAARGKEIFDNKCGICHYADSDAKKIGPGLKGIGKRGTFTVNNNKVTDESLKTWIENGDSLMPPFKEVLEAPQIKDVVAYVRTL